MTNLLLNRLLSFICQASDAIPVSESDAKIKLLFYFAIQKMHCFHFSFHSKTFPSLIQRFIPK